MSEEKKLPGWASPVDAETAIVMTTYIMTSTHPCEVDDSRFLNGAIKELIELFMEEHFGDADYWTSRDYLEEVEKLVAEFMTAWRNEPDWINEGYRLAYGESPYPTVREFLRRLNQYPIELVMRALFHISATWNDVDLMKHVYRTTADNDPSYTKEKFGKFQTNPVKFWHAELDKGNRRRFESQLHCEIYAHPEWQEELES